MKRHFNRMEVCKKLTTAMLMVVMTVVYASLASTQEDYTISTFDGNIEAKDDNVAIANDGEDATLERIVLDDTFDGTVLDNTMWEDISANGGTISQDDRLILTVDGSFITSVPRVRTRYEFPGDFDIQVDYSIGAGWLSPMEKVTAGGHLGGAVMDICARGDCTHIVRFRTDFYGPPSPPHPPRKTTNVLMVYSSRLGWMNLVDFGDDISAATTGKYRIVRNGSAVNFFYDIGAGWKLLDTAFTLSPVKIHLYAGSFNTRHAFVSYFDNFRINSGSTTYGREGSIRMAAYDLGQEVLLDSLSVDADLPGDSRIEVNLYKKETDEAEWMQVGDAYTFTSDGQVIDLPPDTWAKKVKYGLVGTEGIKLIAPSSDNIPVLHEVTLHTQKVPILLIHGIFGSNASWGNLESVLKEEDPNRTVEYYSYVTDWSELSTTDVSISTLAMGTGSSLQQRINGLRQTYPIIDKVGIDIIAHSMGGLIARYYIANCEDNKVRKLIMLGTPNYGAQAAHFLAGLCGKQQGIEMSYGSQFLWDLHHQDWHGVSPSTDVLCIAGTFDLTDRINPFDPYDDSDTIVRVSSASLTNLRVPVCYVPLSHFDSIANIDDSDHPSYKAIKSFLSGEIPESNEGNVGHLKEGMLIVRLVDPSGETVPVMEHHVLNLDLPQVYWFPRPYNWQLGEKLEASDVNPHTGYYYAVGANEGMYDLKVYPAGGYSPVTAHDVEIRARQTKICTLTVLPASASSTNEFASGDTEPVVLGATNVTIDFSSGPGGDVTVHRVDDNPPAVDFPATPRYWDITSNLEDSFSARLSFDYTDEDIAAAGLDENAMVLGYFAHGVWNAVETLGDTVSNLLWTFTDHFSLWTIMAPPAPVLEDVTAMSQTDKFGTRFDRLTGQFSMMATWTNMGDEPFGEPLQMVIESITPDTVTVANEDRTTPEGKPYYDYSNLAGDGRLDPGETSEPEQLVFNNPSRVRFEFDVSCWAVVEGGNAAPPKQSLTGRAHRIHIVIPVVSALAQNYPNPFNPDTWIPYELAEAGNVKISIYDIQGRLVRTLDLGHREIGQYFTKDKAAYWDGRNNLGEKVGSGVYFYQIQAGDFHAVRKMAIVK